MATSISIDELRQDLARVLRDVRAGATYRITDHGAPAAQLVGRHEPRWVSGEDLDAVLRELGGDEAWEHDLASAFRST